MNEQWSRDLSYHYEPMTAEENQAQLMRWFGIHEFVPQPLGFRQRGVCVRCEQHKTNPMHKTGAQQ